MLAGALDRNPANNTSEPNVNVIDCSLCSGLLCHGSPPSDFKLSTLYDEDNSLDADSVTFAKSSQLFSCSQP